MTLRQQLTEDMKTAMKARDAARLGCIRYLLSEIKNGEIDAGGEFNDQQVQEVIRKQVKQMKDAVAEYEKGGRADLVTEENAKIQVYEAYLPASMSVEELGKLVDEVLATMENPVMGAVITAVRSKVEGRADGGTIAAIVKQKLV